MRIKKTKRGNRDWDHDHDGRGNKRGNEQRNMCKKHIIILPHNHAQDFFKRFYSEIQIRGLYFY